MMKQNTKTLVNTIHEVGDVTGSCCTFSPSSSLWSYIEFSGQAFSLFSTTTDKKMQRHKIYTNAIHPLRLTGDDGRPYTPEKVQSCICEVKQLG